MLYTIILVYDLEASKKDPHTIRTRFINTWDNSVASQVEQGICMTPDP